MKIKNKIKDVIEKIYNSIYNSKLSHIIIPVATGLIAFVFTFTILSCSSSKPEKPDTSSYMIMKPYNTVGLETTTTTTTTTTTETTTMLSSTDLIIVKPTTTQTETVHITTNKATEIKTESDFKRFKATYYYGSNTAYGASGRTLVSGYSVASSYYPMGTILYVQSDGTIPDGLYRVDDTGCASNIIDFFYHNNEVPNDFMWMGVTYIDVAVVE